MKVSLTGLVQLPTPTVANLSQEVTHKRNGRLMMIRHTCLCCSNTLLRHTRSKEIYWRCSHCYQEMPV